MTGVDPFTFLVGWTLDRVEDATVDTLPPATAQRLMRMRAWRQSLSEREQQAWASKGAAGPALRDYEGRPYCAPLEKELLLLQAGGPVVHQHEMLWVQAANGAWVMVEALLDASNSAGLAIPAILALELGYCNEAGEPFPQFELGSKQIHTASGIAKAHNMRPVPLSIGGHVFTEETSIKPSTTRERLRGSFHSAAAQHGLLPCQVDIEGTVAASAKSLSIVQVPEAIIRRLNQKGIRYCKV